MLVACETSSTSISAVQRRVAVGAVANAAVPAQQEKAGLVERNEFALCRHLPLAVGILKDRQADDVLAHQRRPCRVGEIEIEHAGEFAVPPAAAVLPGRALQNRNQVTAARRQRQSLQALIVRAAGLRLAGLGPTGARSRVVGREMCPAIALGDERLGRLDRRQHPAVRRKAIDVRTVLVADEEAAVGQPHECLRIDADQSVRRQRQRRKAVPRPAARPSDRAR